MPVLPDTVWAVRLATVSSLDSALSLHDQLTEKKWDAFARIRASREAYWYEIFAGPVAARDVADSLALQIKSDGIVTSQNVFRAHREDLLRGVVTEPWRSSPSGPTSSQPRVSAPVASDKPQLVQFVEPEYHEVARNAQIEGTVVVNVLVGKGGEVLQTEVSESVHLLLDDAAVQAARQCQYVPALEDGQPVEAWLAVPFEFKID
jgi:TonB family protein